MEQVRICGRSSWLATQGLPSRPNLSKFKPAMRTPDWIFRLPRVRAPLCPSELQGSACPGWVTRPLAVLQVRLR